MILMSFAKDIVVAKLIRLSCVVESATPVGLILKLNSLDGSLGFYVLLLIKSVENGLGTIDLNIADFANVCIYL